jgi:NADPH-dependent 2,4-dienoyl-CoA reductase/sulfur reductase-like enzyme/nitrite reductase/ring-hydroxylating ferredoxin subunit
MRQTKAATLSTLANGMTAVDLDGLKLLLVRDGDSVRAFEGVCPHAKAPLEQGALCDGRIICPWHMGSFDARTGALLEPVAMRGLQSYKVEIAGDAVLVDTDPSRLAPGPAAADDRVFAIAGAGAAAAIAAVTLRDAGFTGRILMIGPDPAEPLDRTQLSKMAIAAADFDRDTLPLLDPAWQQRLQLDRIVAAVTALDPAGRRMTLSTGQIVPYDAALLATGAAPVPLKLPGAERMRMLRHLGDVDAILADVRPGGRAVVIGTSFIGMEVASCLAEREMAVTVVGQDAVPFAALFGERVGRALQALHEAKGVSFRLGAKIAQIQPDSVLLPSGERLPADLVVGGTGVRPALDYAPSLSRAEDGGLVTDAGLRVCDGLWAAGDIASPSGWPRIEHWRLAQQHGRIAALAMLGQAETYQGVPFFWSAQAGKRLHSLGHASHWDDVAFDGEVEGFDFTAWYLKDGAVQAALICGRDRAAAILSHAMRRRLALVEARRLVA